MQMSQQPKVGPRSGLLAIANWAKFSLNFSPMSIENMKLFSDLSAQFMESLDRKIVFGRSEYQLG
jgi:hypothetical protein